MALTTQLETAAELYIAATTLWEAARSKITNPTLEIRYEDLVTQPASQLARLGDFLRLDLTGTATPRPPRLISTPSYSNATQPLNDRSIGRWRHYESHLRPILAKLQPWIEAHEAV